MSWFENYWSSLQLSSLIFFHAIHTFLRKLRITSLLHRNCHLLPQILLAEMRKISDLKAICKRDFLMLLEVCLMFSSCFLLCRSWKLRAKKKSSIIQEYSRAVCIPVFSLCFSDFPTFRAVLVLLAYVQGLQKMWWESLTWNILDIVLQSIIVKWLWLLLLLIV